MELLEKIFNCKEEEIDDLVSSEIEELDKNATKVSLLGYLRNGKLSQPFKGFIPLNARIRYSNTSFEDYGMNTTDFFYEFAHFLRKYNLKSKMSMVTNIEYFMNSYFGSTTKKNYREYIFMESIVQTSDTDEEIFDRLKKNQIGDLKKKNAAECTERAALAQQLLSLFGIESYYCMGILNLNGKTDFHSFNVAKGKSNYLVLDYSVSVSSYDKDGVLRSYCPFMGELSNEEFSDFMNGEFSKHFRDYDIKDYKDIYNDGTRDYNVGELKKEKSIVK